MRWRFKWMDDTFAKIGWTLGRERRSWLWKRCRLRRCWSRLLYGCGRLRLRSWLLRCGRLRLGTEW